MNNQSRHKCLIMRILSQPWFYTNRHSISTTILDEAINTNFETSNPVKSHYFLLLLLQYLQSSFHKGLFLFTLTDTIKKKRTRIYLNVIHIDRDLVNPCPLSQLLNSYNYSLTRNQQILSFKAPKRIHKCPVNFN